MHVLCIECFALVEGLGLVEGNCVKDLCVSSVGLGGLDGGDPTHRLNIYIILKKITYQKERLHTSSTLNCNINISQILFGKKNICYMQLKKK